MIAILQAVMKYYFRNIVYSISNMLQMYNRVKCIVFKYYIIF
jgi:hypothetical protein